MTFQLNAESVVSICVNKNVAYGIKQFVGGGSISTCFGSHSYYRLMS